MRNRTRLELFEEMTAVPTDECILWPYAKTSNGYPAIKAEGRHHRLHVMSCERAHGPRPKGHVAAHACGHRSCVNPKHLRWATARENAADRIEHGTNLDHEQHPGAKLTQADVDTIRRDHIPHHNTRDLAQRFGVHPQHICAIARRRFWK